MYVIVVASGRTSTERATSVPRMGSSYSGTRKPSRKPLASFSGWTHSSASPVSSPSQAERGPTTPRYWRGLASPRSPMGEASTAKRGTAASGSGTRGPGARRGPREGEERREAGGGGDSHGGL